MKTTNKDINRYINVANNWEKKYSEAKNEYAKIFIKNSELQKENRNLKFDKEDLTNLIEEYRKKVEYYQSRFNFMRFALIALFIILIVEQFK